MNSDQKPNQDSHVSAGATLQAALKMFNGGDYFACHEFLEALWLDEHGTDRELYKGILQIGIGLLHLQRGNLSGARRLLLNGSKLIEPFTPSLFGIDLRTLLSDARSVLRRLEESNRTHSFQPEDAIQIQIQTL